jgi:hypothetical protein
MDQSLFAAPHGLSQRITSFIACACQGIHQLPFFHLIILIANAHLYLLVWQTLSFSLALKGVPNITRTNPLGLPPIIFHKPQLPFTTAVFLDAINVFDKVSIERTPVQFRASSLRPASRDLSGGARSGNTNQPNIDVFANNNPNLCRYQITERPKQHPDCSACRHKVNNATSLQQTSYLPSSPPLVPIG